MNYVNGWHELCVKVLRFKEPKGCGALLNYNTWTKYTATADRGAVELSVTNTFGRWGGLRISVDKETWAPTEFRFTCPMIGAHARTVGQHLRAAMPEGRGAFFSGKRKLPPFVMAGGGSAMCDGKHVCAVWIDHILNSNETPVGLERVDYVHKSQQLAGHYHRGVMLVDSGAEIVVNIRTGEWSQPNAQRPLLLVGKCDMREARKSCKVAREVEVFGDTAAMATGVPPSALYEHLPEASEDSDMRSIVDLVVGGAIGVDDVVRAGNVTMRFARKKDVERRRASATMQPFGVGVRVMTIERPTPVDVRAMTEINTALELLSFGEEVANDRGRK